MEINLANGKKIGDGHPSYIIAEVGINHNGDINIAKKLIDKASFLEIDAIKFQKRTLEELYQKKFLDEAYTKHYSFGSTYGDHKRFLEFSDEQLIELHNHAKNRGIDFLLSGFDFSSFDFANFIIDVPVHKIPSPYVNHFPILEHVAKYGKPMILSTGMHSFEEVEEAVNFIRKFNNQLVLLQCTSLYPCENEQVNLNVVKTYREKLNILSGFSSHDKGIILTVASVALGACVVEKHFTFDRTAKGPDHAASVETRGLELIHNYIRTIEAAMGNGQKGLLLEETPQRIKYGLSIYAKTEIPQGTMIEESMICYKIPGGGLSPKHLHILLG
ncbi:MAG: N-acetylneuraminate synthase family protein, partial [Ignavibacteriaceae bacterium]|nr:N-acetylneuraminate synthase family protein [Ignavibacteriaceae bacterium]